MDAESRKRKLEAIQDEPPPEIWTYNDLADYVVGRIVASFNMVEIVSKERLDKKTGRECNAFWNSNRRGISEREALKCGIDSGAVRKIHKKSPNIESYVGSLQDLIYDAQRFKNLKFIIIKNFGLEEKDLVGLLTLPDNLRNLTSIDLRCDISIYKYHQPILRFLGSFSNQLTRICFENCFSYEGVYKIFKPGFKLEKLEFKSLLIDTAVSPIMAERHPNLKEISIPFVASIDSFRTLNRLPNLKKIDFMIFTNRVMVNAFREFILCHNNLKYISIGTCKQASEILQDLITIICTSKPGLHRLSVHAFGNGLDGPQKNVILNQIGSLKKLRKLRMVRFGPDGVPVPNTISTSEVFRLIDSCPLLNLISLRPWADSLLPPNEYKDKTEAVENYLKKVQPYRKLTFSP